MSALFELGQIVATPGTLDAIEAAGAIPAHYLGRHARGDWGDLCEEDVAENEYSLHRCLRLFSAYNLPDGERAWIITESDQSATTILLPSEY
jgi:hypothetical protein